MAKALLVVQTNVKDSSQEAELNDWYDHDHLADVLTTAGCTKATRYGLYGPSAAGQAKYPALYEFETDHPSPLVPSLTATPAERGAVGHVVQHPALGLVSMGVYARRGEAESVLER